MSGHFVLRNLTSDELDAIQNAWNDDKLAVPVLSTAAHQEGTDNGVGGQFPGWTVHSRDILDRALGGEQLGNRSGLPPHVYLGFGVGDIKQPGKSVNQVVKGAAEGGWITRLERPAGMGLSELHAEARGDWPANKAKAFAKQVKANGVSLEIYEVDGGEVS